MNGKGTRFKSGIEVPHDKFFYTKADGTVGTIDLEEFNNDEIAFDDGDYLKFGTGEDISLNFDGTNFELEGIAAATPFNIGAAGKVLNVTQHGTFTVGVDDTGYDVKFFGATAGKYLMWDESGDLFKVVGGSAFLGNVSVGEDGTGNDFLCYGDTSGCFMLWDQSEDQLLITGPADVPALKIAGAGSFSPAAYGTAGSAWADTETPAFVADQKYLIIDFGGTLYRIPVFANA